MLSVFGPAKLLPTCGSGVADGMGKDNGSRMGGLAVRTLVGARGFEPRTSCAQGRRAGVYNICVLNHFVENSALKPTS